MPHTGLKCLNANFIYCATYLFIFFFFNDLHLQIIASISPNASVENSSAQWAILFSMQLGALFMAQLDLILQKTSDCLYHI